jgi:membrane protease subunit (stomatin/prohibitin family)
MPASAIIQFQGPVEALVWKSPTEDFNSTTQLVVDETHEAIVMIEGRTELYAEGRHTLVTPNIPGVGAMQRAATGGETPFKCKVYFVDKAHAMDILWGTSAPIAVEDPVFKILIHVMMCGSMGFVVADSMKFVRKCTGFRDAFDSDELTKKYRGIISTYVKDCIARIMTQGGIGYYGINAYLRDVSEILQGNLEGEFDEYGIKLTYFKVEDITTPEADTVVLAAAKARQAGRTVEGFTWQQEQQADIAKGVANNQGSMGEVMGAAAGFMVGGAMGGTVADVARSVLSDGWGRAEAPLQNRPAAASSSPTPLKSERFDIRSIVERGPSSEPPPEDATRASAADSAGACAYCGEPLAPGAAFCGHCGKAQPQTCGSCGASVTQPGARFCASCGQPLLPPGLETDSGGEG